MFVSKEKTTEDAATNSTCGVQNARFLSHHLRIRVGMSSDARSPPPLAPAGDGADVGGGGGGDDWCGLFELSSPPQHSLALGGDTAVCGLKRPQLSLCTGDKTTRRFG